MKLLAAILPACLLTACATTQLMCVYEAGADPESYDARWAYVDTQGDTIVPLGRYSFCYSDTIRRMGFVIQQPENRRGRYDGVIAIDTRGRKLFNAYIFDNGPDYPTEGLFRIRDDRGRIGFADTTGCVVIKPRFEAAYGFEGGRAQVAFKATEERDGEYHYWVSGEWFEIDARGRRIRGK